MTGVKVIIESFSPEVRNMLPEMKIEGNLWEGTIIVNSASMEGIMSLRCC